MSHYQWWVTCLCFQQKVDIVLNLKAEMKGELVYVERNVGAILFQKCFMFQKANNTAWDLAKGPIQESEMLTEYNDGGRPVEVADDADSYDWNPLEDCNQRITLKLHSMQGERCLSTDDIGVLNMAKGNKDIRYVIFLKFQFYEYE